ncbi:MAG: hypothetical protein JWP17_3476 [Solirubrobacterales bacterium]|jgi:ABC-type transporter Mla MlaB component|nr:hypothetical protein [Solirubrobacterales bacterium]
MEVATRPPRAIAFAIYGPITHGDVPGLCARVCALLRPGAIDLAFCDVLGVEPTAGSVDALARLQLVARRTGCQVHLRRASPALRELVAFMGLRDVLPE